MRKLALTITMAIAALAMTASTANAAMEVRDPDTGQLCPAVSPTIDKNNPPVGYGLPSGPWQGTFPGNYQSGGCTVHLTSLGSFSMSSGQQCYLEYDLHIGPDGWGYADNFWYYAGGTCSFSTPGSRVVMPPDVQPGGWYADVDGDTDFNIELYASDVSGNPTWGWASLDVVANPQYTATEIDNQLDQNTLFGSFEGGGWWSDDSLTITHN